jgi:chromosome condensin MukBEF ATPase and DNA-binding subunit MukB
MAVGIRSRTFARWLAPVVALLMVFQLTACGDKEPEQRKAFIDYLQNTVMRSGQNLPTLSEDQRQKFGKYADDYTIILTFSRQMKQSVNNSLAPAVNTLAQIRVPQDYLQQKAAVQQAAGTLNTLTQQIQTAKATADTAQAALKQPDDLKAVYNQVYAQDVTQPANALLPVVPALSSLTQDIIAVGDFNGSVQFPSQQQVTQYNAMMTGLLGKQQALVDAQKLVAGSF